jgi:mitofusin
LANELKVVDQRQAGDRVFFVSAKEALEERTKGPGSVKADGFKGRLAEFESFERKFEECLSKSAISTKFKQHAMKGLKISSETYDLLEQLERSSSTHRTTCESKLMQRQNEMDKLMAHRESFVQESDSTIHKLGSEVETMVDVAMRDEISHLNQVVNDYTTVPFSVNNMLTFIEGLYSHVDQSLDQNLMASCNASVSQTLRQTQQQLLDSAQSSIPSDMCLSPSVVSKEDILLSYEMDCQKLCVGFQPNLQFRFTWGLVLIRRWLGPEVYNYTSCGLFMPQGSSSVPTEATTTSQQNQLLDSSLVMWAARAMTSSGIQSIWPVVTVAALTWQTIGWKIVAMAGTAIACVYGYERLCWTNRAKETTFKQQFVSFAAEKLQLVVAVKSKDCKQQVQRELRHSVVELKSMIDHTKGQLESEISQLESDIRQYQNAEIQARKLKNEMSYFKSELQKFMTDFQLHD